MADVAATRPSLLMRVRDARDHVAWGQFVEIYAPLIYGFARKRGLQDADAADVAQEVLRSVARALPGLDYDAKRGSFRGWLFVVTRNQINKFLGRRPLEQPGDGSDLTRKLEQQPSPLPEEDSTWDLDYERRLFRWAADRIKPTVAETTWQAFWQSAVDGQDAKEIAGSLGLSVAAVYMAKSRLIARIRELIAEVQGDKDHA